MNHLSRPKLPQPDHLKDGNEAFLAGRYNLAAEAFTRAHRNDPRNPVPLFNIASARERLGDIDEAATNFTLALRLRPGWCEPAQRLSLLLARYVLPTPGDLNPHGLLAAFAFDHIDQQPVAAAAIAYLRAHTPLGAATNEAGAGRALEAARNLLLKRTDKCLSHPLLHAALARDVNHVPDFERLLTAMRRVVLMELPPARMEDKALIGFVGALLQQCLNNEYVFAVSPEEKAALDALAIDWTALAGGSRAASCHLLKHMLYQPPHAVLGGRLTCDDCRKLRPRAFADIIIARLKEDAALSEIGLGIPSISTVEDAISRRVAQQYEANPYPRWTSMHMPARDSARRVLERYFAPESLSFLETPFKVLIAGAGTGMHAIAVGVRYGEKADVLAIDLSRRSLAYGKTRAPRFGVDNVRFAQADILNIGPDAGLFDIVEAIGVLHHLADPFEGWRSLLKLLRPGGLMAVGLYSAVSRQNIADLRAAADFPGAGCDEGAARGYRARLMARQDEGAAWLTKSHDFYSLSNFRDLVLHEHERPLHLREIAAFVKGNGLVFRGFVLPAPIEAEFLHMFPDDALPGKLSNWEAFEAKHPRTFDGMYQFWCEKR